MKLRSYIAVFAAVLVCVLALPGAAFAEYASPSTSTVAQVRTDGSLHVAEQRTFDFADSYSVLTWPITGWNDQQKVTMESVRFMEADSEGNILRDWAALPQVAFQSTWRDFVETTDGLTARVRAEVDAARHAESTADNVALPEGEAWAFDERRDVVYIFLDPASAVTAIECDYLVDNAALVWDDVGELYWDYVAASEDVEARNVSVQVQLPVPEGAPVAPGDNVLAWGHGAAGTVDVNEDGTVDYAVPVVEPGQYAQAHIVFPKSWMTNLTIQAKLAKSGVRYDDAVAEEDAWTDSYSVWRKNSLILDVALLALCVLALAASLLAYGLLGRERRPRVEDARLCDDGLLDDAPVMGRLGRWNHESPDDFAASLAQLKRKGVLRIDEVPRTALEVSIDEAFAPEGDVSATGGDAQATEDERDVWFRLTPSAKRVPLSALEQDTLRFVFDDVGGGYQSVSLDEIREFCARRPDEVRAVLGQWQAVLSKEVERAALFDPRSRKAALWMLGGAGALALMALYQWFGARSPWEALALAVTAAVVSVVAHYVPRLTQRGADLAECLRLRSLSEGDAAAGEDGAPGEGSAPSEDASADAWMKQLSTLLETTMEGK